jgi:hypothetical protein
VHDQPSIEDFDTEDTTTQLHKAVPKKASRILELADGTEDDDNIPEQIVIDDSSNESIEDETPAESAEAELSKCPIRIC